MPRQNISLFDRSEEISGFASAFHTSVQRGDVYDPNGSYALDSHLRKLTIPTGTAPITLEGSMKMIGHELAAQDAKADQRIIRNLESAIASISLADSFLASSDKNTLSADQTRHVRDNIAAALPGMKRTLQGIKNA